MPSLVEVVSILDYNIENFVYDVSSGAYVRDPKSPVGYKLDRSEGQNGVIRNKENIQSFGGGLVIGESSENYLVLTSRHIVVHNDTLNYFMRLGGRQTDVLRSRAVIRDARLAIREQERNALYNASLIAESYRTDLALISYSKFQTLNRVYDGAVAENIYPIWGKLGVIMGYPDEVMQLAMGILSDSPYPGNFGININGTFGYSGGPVFLLSKKGALAFAGVGRSVPGKKYFIVQPDTSLQFSTKLFPEDISKLHVREVPILSQSRMYAVDAKAISRFLKETRARLITERFRLAPAFRRMAR